LLCDAADKFGCFKNIERESIMGTAHHLHVVHPREVPPHAASPLVLPPLPVIPLQPSPVSGVAALPPPSVTAPERPPQVTETASARCQERGCIFPALGRAGGKCVHHYREEREPAMYVSKQPTRAALDHGKFFHVDEELMFGSREADRRRFDAERQAFFES
jgi:hypothetical protein